MWLLLLEGTNCSCCRRIGGFSRHGVYRKYHYNQRIFILRVCCRCCGRTHALLPSFSLPGTSVGLKEVDLFILRRAQGFSRASASAQFIERGMSESYRRYIERRLFEGIMRAKALLPQRGDHSLLPWQWLISAAGTSARPVYELNQISVSRGWGAFFCALSPAAGRRFERVGKAVSHNTGSVAAAPRVIDSG